MLISKNSIIIEVKNKKYKWELYIGALTIFIYNTRALRSNKVSLLTLQEKKKVHRRCSGRKGVLRNFRKFTGKHLCQILFFNKVAGLRLQLFLNYKRDSGTDVFLWILRNF